MSNPMPITFRWEGDSFVPNGPRWQRECDKQFVIGQTYELVEQHQRSSNSHRHFFASVNEAWKNLPEAMTVQFPTSEHLRKYALIRAGYADSHTLVCSSKAEAIRIASFMRPLDEFGVVAVNGLVVTRYTAKSQSARAMGKEEFQKSKDAVLDVIASMISVPVETLKQNAQAAA